MPIVNLITGNSIDDTAHIVQVALTPIFLLTGAGTLLNVFDTRLAQVSDHHEHMTDLLQADPEESARVVLRLHQKRLRHRLVALDISVSLSALGGAATCGTAVILFLGSLQDKGVASWLVFSFAIALLCVVGGLAAFIADTALAWHDVRSEGALPRIKH